MLDMSRDFKRNSHPENCKVKVKAKVKNFASFFPPQPQP